MTSMLIKGNSLPFFTPLCHAIEEIIDILNGILNLRCRLYEQLKN